MRGFPRPYFFPIKISKNFKVTNINTIIKIIRIINFFVLSSIFLEYL